MFNNTSVVSSLLFLLILLVIKASTSINVCTQSDSCRINQNDYKSIAGPTWDISEEYYGMDDPQINNDIAEAENQIKRMEEVSEAKLVPFSQNAKFLSSHDMQEKGLFSVLEELHDLTISSGVLLLNVRSYATCTLATNTSNLPAMKLFGRLNHLVLRHSRSYSTASDFLNLIEEDVLQTFMDMNGTAKPSEFLIRRARTLQSHSLPSDQENLLDSYAMPGILAWGSLHTELRGKLTVDLGVAYGGTVGLATAEGKLNNPDAKIREKAWKGIINAWKPHFLTCATALNAMNGWRAETNRRRKYDHFLTSNLNAHRMKRSSLNAMMSAVRMHGAEMGRRALGVQSKAFGKKTMQPWDLSAPAPKIFGDERKKFYYFDEAIDIIAESADTIDKEMGDFVRMMRDRRYIEASSSKNKRPGSFFTIFFKSRRPRVYLSDFAGTNSDIATLAHELGHAWHSWVMRDMPPQTVDLPPNLSETASLFLETLTVSELIRRSETMDEKFAVQWTRAQNTHKFLCNVPARFEFEYKLNEKRTEGRLSVEELNSMMIDAWKTYYKDSLDSITEVGSFFATKLHFYIPTMSFYNHSYIFGYLFSMGLLHMRKTLGAEVFANKYRKILRDSGSLTAEDLVLKHLGGKIENEAFWRNAIELVREETDEFESTAKYLGL